MKMIEEVALIGQSARQNTATLRELKAAFMALELVTGTRDRPKQYVIHEEPEFVWEGGSNSEPEAPRPLNPR